VIIIFLEDITVKRVVLLVLFLMLAFSVPATGVIHFEKDVISTSAGDLEVSFIGHGTLMFKYNDKIIHIDPFIRMADYSTLPKADIILLTHHHRDHLDTPALQQIRTPETIVVLTEKCSEKVDGGIIMHNGDVKTIASIKVEAVPAYNLVHRRDNGQLFHPTGEGNGYVLTFGDTRVYIAGDTENTPEMKALQNIDYAFLPMNLPYTMTPEMVADAARSFKPRVLYPYHYGDTDTFRIVELLKNSPEIEVRIRRMK
jgi:L-ascorbate metabolism protein UlaG (beta-lactamase superfamily)